MTAPTPIWTQVLAGLERDVEEVAAAIRDGRPARSDSWTPPTDLGPVPEAMRPRAERLAARIAAVHALAHDRHAGLTGELDDVGRRRAAGAAYLGDRRAR